jgi:hypothetical protein
MSWPDPHRCIEVLAKRETRSLVRILANALAARPHGNPVNFAGGGKSHYRHQPDDSLSGMYEFSPTNEKCSMSDRTTFWAIAISNKHGNGQFVHHTQLFMAHGPSTGLALREVGRHDANDWPAFFPSLAQSTDSLIAKRREIREIAHLARDEGGQCRIPSSCGHPLVLQSSPRHREPTKFVGSSSNLSHLTDQSRKHCSIPRKLRHSKITSCTRSNLYLRERRAPPPRFARALNVRAPPL